jgi:hypothetical protein
MFSPEQQTAAKRLFVSLVSLGESQQDTRARTTLTDPTIREVAGKFAEPNARLVVIDIDAEGNPAAEVSHEALIRYWDRLRDWVEENRAKLRACPRGLLGG